MSGFVLAVDDAARHPQRMRQKFPGSWTMGCKASDRHPSRQQSVGTITVAAGAAVHRV